LGKPFEALGWILDVLADDTNSQVEVQAILHFLTTALLRRRRRRTSSPITRRWWLIMALEPPCRRRAARGVDQRPMQRTTLISEALVRGLLDHRVKGAWSNTQENVFILLALDKYFNAFEKVTPDFVTRIWLGGTYAGEETFKGRSIDSKEISIPMSYLTDQGGTSTSSSTAKARAACTIALV
jgi:hypothetical protein